MDGWPAWSFEQRDSADDEHAPAATTDDQEHNASLQQQHASSQKKDHGESRAQVGGDRQQEQAPRSLEEAVSAYPDTARRALALHIGLNHGAVLWAVETEARQKEAAKALQALMKRKRDPEDDRLEYTGTAAQRRRIAPLGHGASLISQSRRHDPGPESPLLFSDSHKASNPKQEPLSQSVLGWDAGSGGVGPCPVPRSLSYGQDSESLPACPKPRPSPLLSGEDMFPSRPAAAGAVPTQVSEYSSVSIRKVERPFSNTTDRTPTERLDSDEAEALAQQAAADAR